MDNEQYIHGYTKTEHDRLIHQARTLEPFLHKNINLSDVSNALEIGCGVGAQMAILTDKYPETKFSGIDISHENIKDAEILLHENISKGHVKLQQANGKSLPYPDETFDGIVMFFVLEHVSDPLAILREANRVLKPSGKIYCTEVVNSNIIGFPESRIILDYLYKLNELQRQSGGDPDIGVKLGGLFHNTGFTGLDIYDASVMIDARTQSYIEREKIVKNWISVFLSVSDTLIQNGMDASIKKTIHEEFEKYLHNKQSVFVYAAKQIKGVKPTKK